ncbi:M23 family metallopeptidase (plasmid) [Streptomyces globisporus]|uniref:M23 family metallopeptidase n=1 Tax=Streptomyces globisporus TaxID=1908 RepID=UPI003868FB4D|nr:M23 family metallopeptidase [Streptomyces globisporus]
MNDVEKQQNGATQHSRAPFEPGRGERPWGESSLTLRYVTELPPAAKPPRAPRKRVGRGRLLVGTAVAMAAAGVALTIALPDPQARASAAAPPAGAAERTGPAQPAEVRPPQAGLPPLPPQPAPSLPSLDEQLRERAEERRLAEEAAAVQESLQEGERNRAERAARLAREEQADRTARPEGAELPGSGGTGAGSGAELVLPVAGGVVTAGFGQRGDLWSTGKHTGLDLAAPAGTPVRAVADGTVTAVSSGGPLGNHTELTLADGTEVSFSHQQSIDVKRGERVRAGDRIGTVGSTGNTTGPHLHLEVHKPGGELVDPLDWFADRGFTP